MSNVALVVGTKKGLFIFRSDSSRDGWKQSGPYLPGIEINHATLDARSGALYATANNAWFGCRVSYSTDWGETWVDNAADPKTAEGSGLDVQRLWRVQPAGDAEPGVLYCGADPAVLFRSDDAGKTWSENKALSTHPTRQSWNPGAGGLIVHSILTDPARPGRMWVAISAAGVFRSDDAGASWQPKNANLKNIGHKYDPNIPMYTEVGQCIHHLVQGGGDRLYAQSHWGTYRSDDGADTWTEITEGLPSDFGMVMAAHPRNPDVAYVLPLQGAELRCPPDGALRVYRTSDAGKSWQAMTKGLPQSGAFMGTYREGMTVDNLDPLGVYFGTNTGQLYASTDEGDTWRQVTDNLPPISSVSAAVL
ncbi:MAG TPA: sialidase family protein [Dehalococcoidia bacterium]|nr:sialidase family protein [Dehalococcoidia bacterium]